MKELPDPDGQCIIQLRVSKVRSQSVNHLANPRAISSANIQNGFGENEEDKNVFFIEYISDSYQER